MKYRVRAFVTIVVPDADLPKNGSTNEILKRAEKRIREALKQYDPTVVADDVKTE
jgi:hypothetical protein